MTSLPRQLADLARTLTYILGRRPDEFGLVLDEAGFIPVKRLLAALAGEPGLAWVRRRHLEELSALLSPPRFELVGDLIRALDSQAPALRHPGMPPPVFLYIAIAPQAHALVWEEGLKASGGAELALARQPELALKMGRRRCPRPVLVKIQAQAAGRHGVVFTEYGGELFLAPAVPRAFLELCAPAPAKEKPKPEKPAAPLPVPGETRLDLPAFLKEGGKSKRRGRDEPAWKSATRRERRRRR